MYIYIDKHVCMYVYICVCVCVYIYIHIHIILYIYNGNECVGGTANVFEYAAAQHRVPSSSLDIKISNEDGRVEY